ncbi:MAG: hypothetical protein P8X82_09090 [Gemmatimonadales bacterium]
MKKALTALAGGLILTGGGLWLALDSWGAKAPPDPEISDPIALEEQLELLAHKVVVLSARQSDEKELRQELAKLKEQMERIQATLESQPWRRQETEVQPGPEAALLIEADGIAAVCDQQPAKAGGAYA